MMAHTIRFVPAIFITLNVMLGSGLFLNTTELAHRAGALGFISYLIIGILMLPLVVGMSRLVALHPSGGFYAFGAHELHPLLGFASSWTYFVGKLASTTLMVHTATILFQAIMPPLGMVNPLLIDGILIVLFCILNMLNVRIGSMIQYFFFSAKVIPVIAMISIALYWLHPSSTFDICLWSGLPSTLPLVLYAIVGFEAACSLSSRIENASVNAPRAILIAYAIIIALNSTYQFCAYALFSSDFFQMKNFIDLFANLAHYVSGMVPLAQTIFYSAIATSALGAAYGILYSNLWNLHALAHHDHTFLKPILTAMNAHHIPIACVVVEGIICAIYLVASYGEQIPLQQVTSLALVLAYSISAFSLQAAIKRKAITMSPIISLCALINCCMLSGVCAIYLLRGGSRTLYLFFILLGCGAIMAWLKKGYCAMSSSIRSQC